MPATMNVNYMTVVHKKSTGFSMAFPDVCKTPTPGGPVPIPYPNIAMSTNAAKTTKKVKVDKEGVMVKGSNFSMSSGDEAGNAGGGLISSKFKGKAEFLNYSFDVKFEGKAVARLSDPMGNNCGSNLNVPAPAEGQPPAVVTPAQEAEMKEACERVGEQCGVDPKDRAKVAQECGMDPDHAEAISGVCEDTGNSATFRSTNPECMDKIQAGFPAKGCDISNKTIKDGDFAGFVGDYDSSGNVTGLMTTDGPVSLDGIPPAPVPVTTYTGDYDAHDMFGEGGSRIMNGTPAESAFQQDLNSAIGRGDGKDMVRHGPQANYSDYCDATGKDPIAKLQLPDVSPDEPLIAFDENGNMYKIENEDQLRDYYKCKGQEVPKEWDDPDIRKKANAK